MTIKLKIIIYERLQVFNVTTCVAYGVGNAIEIKSFSSNAKTDSD